MNYQKKVVVIRDVAVSIQQILVCLNKFFFCFYWTIIYLGVADGNEKSISSINNGFASIRVRNRPPLPQANSVTSGNYTISLALSFPNEIETYCRLQIISYLTFDFSSNTSWWCTQAKNDASVVTTFSISKWSECRWSTWSRWVFNFEI
jgi:hypothetical protein